MNSKNFDIGILTFQCSDNYGAMLQAYGLRSYLLKKDFRVEIVYYEPPFMTGRHWWIPYIPTKGILRCLKIGCSGWIYNLKMGGIFFKRRKNMRNFRKKYLIGNHQKRMLFTYQFKSLPYQYYIVGSDQIWNPDITLGLRKAYFGAFKSRNKKKVISYAASLGGKTLPQRYDEEFSKLLKYVDVMSVRESEAIPYIKQFYEKNIIAVSDPVLLLEKEDWQGIERLPDRENYILVYITEANNALMEYAKKLSEKKKIPIIELRVGTGQVETESLIDYTAGPAEFLGYIDKADYVLTNSFHGTVFSIIYQKSFLAFLHNSLGTRIENILNILELEDRLYQYSDNVDIESDINWDNVNEHMKEITKIAEDFLRSAIWN